MIGVIGGNGVAATNRLLALIEKKVVLTGAYRDAHHPEMLIYQATQAPSRSMYLEGRGPSFLEDYICAGERMKVFGCTELCMCCNTAHFFIDELKEKIDIPFINIIELVAKKAKEKCLKKVGVMCSDGCRKHGLYEKYFTKIAPEISVVYPPYKQNIVTKGINNAKNNNRYCDLNLAENPKNCFTQVVNELKGIGCDGIIAGCTDINNVYSYNGDDIVYIDSLEVLAEYIVSKNEYWKGN